MRCGTASVTRSLARRWIVFLLAILAGAGTSAFASAVTGASADAPACFPDLDGWAKDGEPADYEPETLYEYIDGAADIYISYDFQELSSLYYVKGENEGIAVDVYRHGTPRSAFGIYSQERPAGGDFIDIGTQGYYEKGMLNFLLGPYYVKLSGYSLGGADEALLKSVAREVASRLGADPGLPPVLRAFPDSGKVANSEKYVEMNFMGHGFLRDGFTADYRADGREFRVFIIEADDESQAESMVESYVKLANDKGQRVESEGASVRLRDPYQGSKGDVNLMAHGRYIWGMLSDDPALRDYYLKATEEGLESAGLF
jgi:hypothetical protein